MKAKLYVTGMHCANCRTRIEKKLHMTEGVRQACIDFGSKTLEIDFDPGIIQLENIQEIVSDLGYLASEKRRKFNLKTGTSLAVIAVLFAAINYFGILNLLVPGRLADGSMGYATLFLTGLFTSAHCVAMCGGINLSQSLTGFQKKGSRWSAYKPALLYNFARIISYTLTGALLGCVGLLGGIGSNAGLSTVFQGALKVTAGVYMVLTGAGMLGIFPQPRLSFHIFPKILSSLRNKGPFVVGLLNGLMPCGPLQTVQILALASGGPLSGALTMLSFGIGTMPLMFGFGVLVSLLGNKFRNYTLFGGAVLLTVMGLSMLMQGYALAGSDIIYIAAPVLSIALAFYACNKLQQRRFIRMVLATAVILIAVSGMIMHCHGGISVLYGNRSSSTENLTVSKDTAPQEKSAERSPDISNEEKAALNNKPPAPQKEVVVQVVKTTLMPGRYPYIQVQAGIPAIWSIDVPEGSLNMCNFRIFIQEYGIVHTFSEGENTIQFLPEKPGMYMYTCWMGMIRGLIKVI